MIYELLYEYSIGLFDGHLGGENRVLQFRGLCSLK